MHLARERDVFPEEPQGWLAARVEPRQQAPVDDDPAEHQHDQQRHAHIVQHEVGQRAARAHGASGGAQRVERGPMRAPHLALRDAAPISRA
eukprot:scaffold104115_cov67-Phaeocystis_antarctica.AAC.1